MSVAWSIGKSDRCKFKALSSLRLFSFYCLTLAFLVKIDQFQKKNKELSLAAPGAYQSSLVDKRSEPKWTMGARIMLKDRKVSASPDRYNVPSKILESPGKTMGARLGNSIASVGRLRVPGPGTYA